MCENTPFHKFSSLQAEKKTHTKKNKTRHFFKLSKSPNLKVGSFLYQQKQGLQQFLLAKKTPCFGRWVNVPWIF